MLHRLLMSSCIYALSSLIFLGILATPLFAQRAPENVSLGIAEGQFLEDEALLEHPDGLLIVDKVIAQPRQDSPLKDLKVELYHFSDGSDAFLYTGETVPPDAEPPGLEIRADPYTGTYYARELTTLEKSLLRGHRNEKKEISWIPSLPSFRMFSQSFLDLLFPSAYANIPTQKTVTLNVGAVAVTNGQQFIASVTATTFTWTFSPLAPKPPVVGNCQARNNTSGGPTHQWTRLSCSPSSGKVFLFTGAVIEAYGRIWGTYKNAANPSTTLSVLSEIRGRSNGSWYPKALCRPAPGGSLTPNDIICVIA